VSIGGIFKRIIGILFGNATPDPDVASFTIPCVATPPKAWQHRRKHISDKSPGALYYMELFIAPARSMAIPAQAFF
jgi:hypothetical protein